MKCCLPYLRGKAWPPTAEALMRSRYVAFATGAIDYLRTTHDPETQVAFDADATRTWAGRVRWLGLTVLFTEAGGPDDALGRVAFEAQFSENGVLDSIREDSAFRRVENHWVYIDGKPAVD